MWKRGLSWVGMAVAVSACTVDNPYNELVLSGAARPECASAEARFSSEPVPLVELDAVDILMVIDSGPDAGPLQSALAEAMPGFIEALNATDSPNWQIGVVPADISREASRGSLSSGLTSGSPCGALGGDVILRPSTPSVAERAACLVQTGTDGVAGRQPLNAAQFTLFNALDRSSTFYERNSPLLRDNVPLVVLIVTAHEDCSGPIRNQERCEDLEVSGLESFDRLESFFFSDVLRVRNMGRSGIRILAIAGPEQAINDEGLACSSAFDVFSAPRLNTFISRNRPEAELVGACSPSLASPLDTLVQTQLSDANIRYCAAAPVGEGTRFVRSIRNGERTLLDNASWRFSEPTRACPNGVFEISRDALRSAEASSVELLYCAVPRTAP